MQIQTLKIYNIRRFDQKVVSNLHSNLNIIVGPNAQGKTSLLEALSLITRLRSFRTAKTKELVRQGREEASVTVDLAQPTASRVVLSFEGNKKTLKIDDQKTTKSKYSLLGSSISFIPDDLYLLKGSPENRRHFFDELVVQLDPAFVQFYQQHKKILQHRNRVLKGFKEGFGKEDAFDLWTSEFIRASLPIYERRQEVTEVLNGSFPEIYRNLFGVQENVEIAYDHGYEASPSESRMRERLKRVEAGEKAVGYSLVGPHKDDLPFYINGMSAKSYGSQGQLRGIVIALKVAELELTRSHRRWSPILLLDDIISELDDQRVSALIEYLAAYDGQLFVTTAEMNKVEKLHQKFSSFHRISLDPSEKITSPKLPQKRFESGLNVIS